MQKIYSDIELIRYLYGELSPIESMELENCLKGDLNLKEITTPLTTSIVYFQVHWKIHH